MKRSFKDYMVCYRIYVDHKNGRYVDRQLNFPIGTTRKIVMRIDEWLEFFTFQEIEILGFYISRKTPKWARALDLLVDYRITVFNLINMSYNDFIFYDGIGNKFAKILVWIKPKVLSYYVIYNLNNTKECWL